MLDSFLRFYFLSKFLSLSFFRENHFEFGNIIRPFFARNAINAIINSFIEKIKNCILEMISLIFILESLSNSHTFKVLVLLMLMHL